MPTARLQVQGDVRLSRCRASDRPQRLHGRPLFAFSFLFFTFCFPSSAHAEWAGPDRDEQELLKSIKADKLIRAREQAEKLLKERPDSVVARYGLAMVFHDEEANLARALFHIRLAEEQVVRRFGRAPAGREEKVWHARILMEQSVILGEMDRRPEQIEVLDRHDRLEYKPNADRYRIWPLMKLHHFKQAREMARKVSLDRELYTRISGLNGMIAIESERQRPDQCFKVGFRAVTETGYQSCILNQNTAEAAFGVYRFSEAESLALKSIQAPIQDCPASAYPHLANLYLLRADFQRAMEAVKSSRASHVEKRYRQQFEMSNTAWLARLLSTLGKAERALELAERVIRAPDRVGMTSFSDEVMRVIYAVDYHALLLARMEDLREEASVRPLTERPARWAEIVSLRQKAWTMRRRISRLLSGTDDMSRLVRPYIKPLPPWNSGSLIRAVGEGVVLQAVTRARGKETTKDPAQKVATAAYFDALEGEAAWRKGWPEQALAKGEAALAKLPKDEALLRGRVAAWTADAALTLGNKARAEQLFEQVLHRFPSVLRILGVRLPAKVMAAAGPESQATAERLLGSHRLRPDVGLGFVARVTGKGDTLRVCLEARGGRRYACADTLPEPQARGRRGAAPKPKDADARVSLVLDRFHRKVFAPKIDLTQREINSLDGSAVRGDADSVLRDVLGEEGE